MKATVFISSGRGRINAMNVIDKYWECAQIASNLSGVDAKILYSQFSHETAGFTSELCVKYNNLGGITQTEPNELPQPDGSYYYKEFDSPEAFAVYFGRYLGYYPGPKNTIEEYATVLKEGGYFGDTLENYIAGMNSAYNDAFG